MKLNLLLCFSLVVVFSMKAQTWCPPGAIWSYTVGSTYTVTQPRSGVINDIYQSDSLINGKLCKHILGTFKGKDYPNAPVMVYNKYRESYTYENNKVIYVWAHSTSENLSAFDTVVNFNAAIGDKWLKNRWGGTCNSRRAITVTDTGRVTINGISLKRIVTSYTGYYIYGANTYTFIETDTLMEKIMHRSKFMIPEYCEVDNVSDGFVSNGDFLCYKDSLFPNYQRPGTTSCAYIADGISELNGTVYQTRIYPNPGSGKLILESEAFIQNETYRITMLNVLGQTVTSGEIKCADKQLTIDPGQLNTGIYYLQLRDKNRLLASEKIVRE